MSFTMFFFVLFVILLLHLIIFTPNMRAGRDEKCKCLESKHDSSKTASSKAQYNGQYVTADMFGSGGSSTDYFHWTETQFGPKEPSYRKCSRKRGQ